MKLITLCLLCAACAPMPPAVIDAPLRSCSRYGDVIVCERVPTLRRGETAL